MVVLGCIVKLCRNVEAGSVRIPRRCSSNITTQFVTVEDRQIHVAQTGRGDKALLLLPGALGSALSDLKPQLEGLDGEKLTVVGWDPPGYGQSRPPARRWENFFREDAEMAVKTMTALGHHKFSLAGWSDGGITALCAAAKFPHNIDKLVVWGSNAYISQWDIDNIDQVSDVSKWSERMRKPMEEMYGDSFPSLWSGWCQAYKDYFTKQGGDICVQDLANITAPTLVIHGMKDVMVAEEHVHHLAQNIPNSEKVIWQEGKHNLHLKYSKEFNTLIQDFIMKQN